MGDISKEMSMVTKLKKGFHDVSADKTLKRMARWKKAHPGVPYPGASVKKGTRKG